MLWQHIGIFRIAAEVRDHVFPILTIDWDKAQTYTVFRGLFAWYIREASDYDLDVLGVKVGCKMGQGDDGSNTISSVQASMIVYMMAACYAVNVVAREISGCRNTVLE